MFRCLSCFKYDFLEAIRCFCGRGLSDYLGDDRLRSSHSDGRWLEKKKSTIAGELYSQPVKSLIEHGLLKPGKTFFDYGCGHGTDIEGLTACSNLFRPHIKKRRKGNRLVRPTAHRTRRAHGRHCSMRESTRKSQPRLASQNHYSRI